MTSPLLQEAAKVVDDAYEEWWTSSYRIKMDWKEYTCAALIRWLLTREPTERMYDAAMDAWPIDRKFSTVYRAMNAALLKEMG